MKKLMTAVFFSVMLLLTMAVPMSCSANVTDDGYCNGILLSGRVKIVSYGADLRVKVVEHFADLRVKRVDHFAHDVGEWQFVDYGEDFSIQFVDHFPDLTIKFVQHFPGVN